MDELQYEGRPYPLRRNALETSVQARNEEPKADQQSPVKDGIFKSVRSPQSNVEKTRFTVGILLAHLDALPERKSFRACLRSLPPCSATSRSHICLNCKQIGHVLDECPYPIYHQKLDWNLATKIHIGYALKRTTQEIEKLCSRCERLAINSLDPENPIEKAWPLETKYEDFERSASWVDLGSAAYLTFQADCSFCRLLASITESPINWTEDLILTQTNSDRRLGAPRYRAYRKSSVCTYVTTKPISNDWNKSKLFRLKDQNIEHAMDSIICLSQDSLNNYKNLLPLGGRRVNPSFIDESILSEWLRRCEELHGRTCSPDYLDELRGIRLVDIVSRKVVPYPVDHRCDYIALSYVWGKCEPKSYTLGSHIETVPQTIEDAMTVTKLLGKRYLWVDSLTIDQSDSAHKAAQIKLMSSIYRGAWATIIALSGRCAASGLPRVNAGRKMYPDIVFTQISATLGGIEFVSTMPTLAQQLKLSHWNRRAWTLQEGLLSPRCLYFTAHQVYFQCNTFQCCESIDDTTSPSHNQESPLLSDFGSGILKSNFLVPSQEASQQSIHGYSKYRPGLEKYWELLGIYCTRQMTSKLDKINAFSGILQALESLYFKDGFHYGIPISELPWSLLWEGDFTKPLADFPSWSWAGWQTHWMYNGPPLMWFKKDFSTYLQILRQENGSLVQLYHFAPPDVSEVEMKKTDPLWDLPKQDADGPLFPTSFSPHADVSHLLYIDGIVLSFVCPSPASTSGDRVDWELDWNYDERKFELGGAMCTFRYLISLEKTLRERHGQPQTFLLVARDLYHDELTYWLLLLDKVDSIMYRNQSVRLITPYHQKDCIKHANPRRTRLILG